MTAGPRRPLSRPYSVRHLGSGGTDVTVEAAADERSALARDLGLVELGVLRGRYRLEGRPERVHVTGRVEADVVQTCVVTLEPFPARIDEPVDLVFAEPAGPSDHGGGEFETDLDAPDDLVDGRIDLGAVTAELLALGLDPYPRKPGAELEERGAVGEEGSPFGALAGLLKKGG